VVWFGRVTPGTRRYGVDMPTTRTGAANPSEPGVTTGVTGHPWRASVSASGDIEPWDRDQEPVRWYVAADDRWHDPAEDTAVRQIRIDGTPVTETRLRIPDGDAVQRVWTVADHGGLTIMEIENDSARPIAVALTGGGLLTERPPTDVAVKGIELDASAIVLPVGHRSSARVAISHRRRDTGPIPARVPPVAAVVSGWLTVCERASRLGLPDQQLVDAVTAARCDLLLDGPVDAADPLGFLADVAQIVRLGDDADAWLPEVIGPLERIGRERGPRVDDVLVAVERLAVTAGDERAAGDIAALVARRRRDGLEALASRMSLAERIAVEAQSRGAFVDAVERSLVAGGDVLPGGLPPSWLGANFEVHGLPTSARSTLSFAVRWHGERPALLWEQTGPPVILTARAIDAAWQSDEPSGETLLAAPARLMAPADDPVSFT
jgi:hypothetical protein